MLDEDFIRGARAVEMETFKEHGMHEKRPSKVCRESTGNGPAGVKWVDTNQGEKSNP